MHLQDFVFAGSLNLGFVYKNTELGWTDLFTSFKTTKAI